MERYQVILAYDGSRFKGFQRQAKDRSVQGVVEAALRLLDWKGKSILAAGRTDTGAHATGQVISFDLDWKHSLPELQKALNKNLPSDAVAVDVKEVRATFHPRYDANWRKYEYRVYCQPIRHPLLEHYAWRVWPAVNLSALKEIAQPFVGTHDFGAFGTPPHSEGNTIRHVLESNWHQEGLYFIYEIKAHAFLYHMVRRIVFTQVRIAQGKLERTELDQALTDGSSYQGSRDRLTNSPQRLVHGLAPARGLILVEVHYPAEAMG